MAVDGSDKPAASWEKKGKHPGRLDEGHAEFNTGPSDRNTADEPIHGELQAENKQSIFVPVEFLFSFESPPQMAYRGAHVDRGLA